MKKSKIPFCIFIVLVLSCTINYYHQYFSVEYHFIRWDAKTKFVVTKEKFNKMKEGVITIKKVNFSDLFNNLKEAKEMLISNDQNNQYQAKFYRMKVKIKFNVFNSIVLYFAPDGSYQYKNQWYNNNVILYKTLFCYFFSNYIVNNEL